MDKILLVLNPHSGRGHVKTMRSLVEGECHRRDCAVEVICEEDKERASGLIAAEAENFDLVLSAGGDGTNYTVVNAMMKTRQRNLGLLPVGTGNDLARSLGLTQSMPQLIRRIFEGRPGPLDLGEVAGHYFLNTASLGFDVEVIARYDEARLLGRLGYVEALMKSLGSYTSKTYRFLGEKEISATLFALVVSNGSFYGGGVPICPEASPTDGKLNLLIAEAMSTKELFRFLPRLYRGKHTDIDLVHTYETEGFRLGLTPQEINLDGERVAVEGEIAFTILPGEICLWGRDKNV